MLSTKDLLDRLHAGDPSAALAAAQAWIARPDVGYPAIYALIDHFGANPARQAEVTTLFRDLLSCYPATLWGVPVLIACDGPIQLPDLMSAPPPVEGAWDLRWHSIDRGAGQVALPGRSSTVQLPPWQICCALLTLVTPDALAEPIQISNDWWRGLFESRSPSAADPAVYVSARMHLPLPDALEAAEAMLRGARGAEVKTDSVAGPAAELAALALGRKPRFLSDYAALFAAGAGRQFARDLAQWQSARVAQSERPEPI
jgi:hypothetical protein